MNFPKVSCLILLASVSLAAALSVSRAYSQATVRRADGGDPQPPWPHLRAVPSRELHPVVVADGGDPQPPWPNLRAVLSHESQPVLMA